MLNFFINFRKFYLGCRAQEFAASTANVHAGGCSHHAATPAHSVTQGGAPQPHRGGGGAHHDGGWGRRSRARLTTRNDHSLLLAA
jgi:hypothetical protein